MQPHSLNRTKVFISYSHKDTRHLERLHVHLADLERQGLIEPWSDKKITPGENWREKIRQAIASAKVAVLLISVDFLASQFIAEDELPSLLATAKTEGTVIIPVILGPCGFEYTRLAQFQAVNDPSKPLIRLNSHQREELWVRVAKTIRDTIVSPSASPERYPGLSKNDQNPLKAHSASAEKLKIGTATQLEMPSQFEDRLLYELINLTGNQPLPMGSGVSEADLAVCLADELGISSAFPYSSQFYSSDERGTVLTAVDALEREGLLEALKVLGPWTIRPTHTGRRRVDQWLEAWKKAQSTAELSIMGRAAPDFKILTPPTFQENNPNWIDVNASEQHIEIKNIGKENAYDIYAALLGCETYIVPQTMPQKRMDGLDGFHWRDYSGCPLEPGTTSILTLKRRRDKLTGSEKIGGYCLYAPQEPSLFGIQYNPDLPFYSARLTLTYRDNAQNKYAQTFDYNHYKHSWTYLAHPRIISRDLLDLLNES